MPRLSCITTCKSRLEHLRVSLPRMLALGDLEVVVVDYDCPERSGDWAARAHPKARTVRVEGEPYFNVSRARNLGAGAAAGEWLLFLDADTVPQPSLGPALKPLMTAGVFRIAAPRPQALWGALLVSRADFERVGGYDEAFEGWGSEDEDIVERLRDAGVRADVMPGELFGAIDHGDDLRVKHHAVKDVFANNCVNHVYRLAKRDLGALGQVLSLGTRRRIYAEIKAAAARESGGFVDIAYRQRRVGGRLVTMRLRYDLVPHAAGDTG